MGYIGRDNTLSTFTKQSITADGGTSFTLNQGVGDSSSILVSIGGIVQQPDVAYSASGTSLTFTSAPTNAYPIWVIYLGKELTVTSETATDNVDSQAGVGNGTATPITLVNSVPSAQSIIVTLNGIGQVPGTDFTVSGTTLTFTTAPSAAMDILVYYVALSGTVNVPVDYSVSSASQFVASGTWPAWNGAALTNVGGDATQADVNGLIASLATLSFLQSVDHSTALLNFVNGWDDTFTVATSVVDEGRSIPKIQMDGQGNYALTSTCSNAGMVNGPAYLFSCIVNFSGNANGTLVTLVQSSNARWLIERSTDNKLTVSLTATGTFSFGNLGRIKSTSNFVAADGDIYLQVAVNTATQTMQIVKNGVLETNVVTHTLNAGTIMLDNGNYAIGDSAPVNGWMAQWYHALSFLDLSVQANREKFVTGTGASARAVDLGADGSLPTGSQPAVYLNNPYATWNVNLGSGNNFTANQMVLVDGGYLDTDKLYSSDSFTNSYDLIDYYGKEHNHTFDSFAGAPHAQIAMGTAVALPACNISKLGFVIHKFGSPTGNVYAEIHEVTGTPGSAALSNGTVLASSDVLLMQNISTTTGIVTTFNFPDTINLPAGNYGLVVRATGGDASHRLHLEIDFTSPSDTGANAFRQTSAGVWDVNTNHDFAYYLYGNTNLDLKTKGTNALTTVDSPASAPTKGHIEALVDENASSPYTSTYTHDHSGSGANNGFGGYSIRNVIPSADISASGEFIRLTLLGDNDTSLWLDNVSIVERVGNTGLGATTPTEILYGGSSGVQLPVGTTTRTKSDWTEFSFDSSKDYLVIFDVTTDAAHDDTWSNTSSGDGYYAMTGNTYNLATPTIPSNAYISNRTAQITELEVANKPTINTDIIGELSRDGGTTWSPATLTRSSTGIDGATSEILSGDVDFTGDPSGTNVVGRIRTVNKDKLTVDGISVNWS